MNEPRAARPGRCTWRANLVDNRVRLAGVAASLPPLVRSSEEVEAMIARASHPFHPRAGSIEAISGVRSRRVAAADVQCSDLAADAARRAMCAAAVDAPAIDLLIFAAASQDLIEPATAHIVQEKLGTTCQVMDVKNACNSFLNGLQLAEAMILSGACHTVLVATGEVCSRAIDWRVGSASEFRRNFPGYTMGDAGAAAVVTRSNDERGIFYRRFVAASAHWRLATIGSGGSRDPRSEANAFLHADGARLKRVFVDAAPRIIRQLELESGVVLKEFDRILVHQATVPYLKALLLATGIDSGRVEHTVAELGNMAAASLPVAFALALERGTIAAGDRVLWLGLASGISVGAMMMHV
jgi:3-oxoacyl-(acyl-carrier-protein) synthase III